MKGVSTTSGAEPVMACVYGPSGVGKTSDLGFSFPHALFIAAPGALQSVRNLCGYNPKSISLNTIQEVTKILPDIAGHFDAVVIDDFSFLAEQTFSVLEKKHKGFQLWGALRDATLDFRDKARHSGIHVVLTAWEAGPRVSANGKKIRGGPKLSGDLPEQLPAMCDVVLRAVHEPTRKPWPVVYRCGTDPGYSMKDRYNVASVVDPAPLNLGEILRAAGVNLTRIDEGENGVMYQIANGVSMEDLVQKISEQLSGDPMQDAAAVKEMYSTYRGHFPNLPTSFLYWVFRDATDRSVIRARKAMAESTFSLV